MKNPSISNKSTKHSLLWNAYSNKFEKRIADKLHRINTLDIAKIKDNSLDI